MNSNYDFDDLDDYLNDRLTETDRHDLEAALAADPQLALQLKALQAEAAIFHHLLKKDLQKKIARWENEALPRPTARRKMSVRWMVVAVLLLGGGTILWIWQSRRIEQVTPPVLEKVPASDSPALAPISDTLTPHNQVSPKSDKTPPPPQAFYRNLVADPNQGLYESPSSFHQQNMGTQALQDSSCYNNALAQYVAEHFAETAHLLLNCADSTRINDVLYLRAHAYFRLSRYGAAAREFSQIRSGELYYDAQWYQLLSLLAQMPGSRKAFEAQLMLIEKSQANEENLKRLKSALSR